jgi:hypothetical protein
MLLECQFGGTVCDKYVLFLFIRIQFLIINIDNLTSNKKLIFINNMVRFTYYKSI